MFARLHPVEVSGGAGEILEEIFVFASHGRGNLIVEGPTMTFSERSRGATGKYLWLRAAALGVASLTSIPLWAGSTVTARGAETPEAAAARERQGTVVSPPGEGEAFMAGAAKRAPSAESGTRGHVTSTNAKGQSLAPWAEPAGGDAPMAYEFPPAVIERLKNEVSTSSRAFKADGEAVSQQDLNGTPNPFALNPKAPVLLSSFAGTPYTGWIPPDPHLAVGPSDLILAVNSTWRIYNKFGGQVFSRTLGSWFANVLPANQTGISVFDPWVIYDRVSSRFVLLALAKRNSDKFSRYLISVSDNSTASGNWCNWSLNASVNGSTNTNNWADYAKVGTTSNAIVLTSNQFNFPNPNQSFQYTKVRFIRKSQIYSTSCPAVSWWDFWNLRNADNSTAFTVQPALSYFASTTSYGINSYSGGGARLTLWRFGTPSWPPSLVRQSTLFPLSYTLGPNAVQRGSSTRINTGDARLLDAVWRASGLWTTHTVGCTFAGDPTTRSCIRWYNINPGTNVISQQRSFGNSGSYYYYPAITATATGNATIVFNRSGSTEYAGARYTGRRSTDPPNTLQGSANLASGQGCYVRLDTSGRNRWGDYNGIGLDPTDERRTWIYSEYASGTSTTCTNNVWGTRFGRVTW